MRVALVVAMLRTHTPCPSSVLSTYATYFPSGERAGRIAVPLLVSGIIVSEDAFVEAGRAGRLTIHPPMAAAAATTIAAAHAAGGGRRVAAGAAAAGADAIDARSASMSFRRSFAV